MSFFRCGGHQRDRLFNGLSPEPRPPARSLSPPRHCRTGLLRIRGGKDVTAPGVATLQQEVRPPLASEASRGLAAAQHAGQPVLPTRVPTYQRTRFLARGTPDSQRNCTRRNRNRNSIERRSAPPAIGGGGTLSNGTGNLVKPAARTVGNTLRGSGRRTYQ